MLMLCLLLPMLRPAFSLHGVPAFSVFLVPAFPVLSMPQPASSLHGSSLPSVVYAKASL